jgi:hypothetical protein
MNNFFTEVLVSVLPFFTSLSAETLNAEIASFLTKILGVYMVSFCIQVELVNVKFALFVHRILFLILACLASLFR